jgi:putative thioredoxin
MIETIESPYIHAGNRENFEQLVLRNSQQGPVLVNFWSRKAGPCLRQYPLLDKLVHAYDGRLLLVNVDVDAETAIAAEYGVASVPTLKLLRRREVVETLHGYHSEADLSRLLERHVARDSDQELADAIASYSRGERQQAYAAISAAIVRDPVNPRLPLTLCKLLKHEGRYGEALTLLASLPSALSEMAEVDALRDELGWLQSAHGIGDVEALIEAVADNPQELQGREQLSAFYALNGEYAEALRLLAEIIEREPDYHDSHARTAMLKIFKRLGGDHELVKRFRPKLQSYRH